MTTTRAGMLVQPQGQARAGATGAWLRRKCACGTHTPGGGECPACARRRLQRKSMGNATERAVPSIVHEVLRSPGQPLDMATRAYFDQRFDHDFSAVRVHTGAQAAESVQAVGALAYTVGPHVVFGAGRYAPATREGGKLLAHELAHVVQQGQVVDVPSGALRIGAPDDAHEYAADRAAEGLSEANVRLTGVTTAPGPRLQRACGPAALRGVGGCVGLGGDITDFGDDADLFRFKVSCDEFLAGEETRLRARARGLGRGDAVDVHGFASEEGAPAFNEPLSCARANAAQRVIQSEAPGAKVALFQHGATAGTREDRRSVKLSVRSAAQQPAATPEDCSRRVGDCEFYRCRDRRHPCGADGYYLGYGNKYCERFTHVLQPQLSPPGRAWVERTKRCLMEHVDRRIPIDAPCDQVKRSAFDSHPSCYVEGGICYLDSDDWMKIVGTIDAADMELKQTIVTGVACLANYGALLIPGSVGTGSGLHGLMDRDRRRAFGF